MKASELRKLIREEVRNILTEDVNLIATGDKDLKSIIEYLNSIGIKPVYPRFFTGTFTKNRQLDVDISRDSRPFTKEYTALQDNETKFRQILRKANVPDKPVLVCTYQDDFGSYVLGIYNTRLKETSAALTSSTKNFKSFIVK